MRVTLLGTGSSDGWPNPFCRCRSCEAERRAGRSRAPSSVLVDGVVLIDAGPTTPHRSGSETVLADIEHLLVTHGHPDHLQPAILLSRHWAHPRHTLHVWGPPLALDQCRGWLAPDARVELHVLEPGATRILESARGRYQVRALPARHAHGDGDVLAEESLLYVLTGADGTRLLYATDTGPFTPADIGLGREPLQAVLIDETFGDRIDHRTGHLDLVRLPAVLEDLRRHGAIDAGTRVFATHLSHHNPPTAELRRRLAPLAVELLDDLATFDTRGKRPRHRLVLGGARSGKSRHAESLADNAADVTYVATGGMRPGDYEWAERVQRHRERRPAHWTTIETVDLVAALDSARPGATLLVDCLALWLTAVLDELDAWTRIESGDRSIVDAETAQRSAALADSLDRCQADVILVSNEVGMGIVPMTPSGRAFQDLLGTLNAQVADHVDEVVLMVAGRPLPLPAGMVRRADA